MHIIYVYVTPLRLERRTNSLEGYCSIQLSYGVNCCTSAATRTQDSYIKSVILYQLSYERIKHHQVFSVYCANCHRSIALCIDYNFNANSVIIVANVASKASISNQ